MCDGRTSPIAKGKPRCIMNSPHRVMNSRGEMETHVEGVSSSLFSPIIIDNFGSSDEDKIDKNL